MEPPLPFNYYQHHWPPNITQTYIPTPNQIPQTSTTKQLMLKNSHHELTKILWSP